jgi:hypothetical protein
MGTGAAGKCSCSTTPSKCVVHVKPIDGCCTAFTLGDQERFLFDSVASEVTNIAGTALEYFALDKEKTKRDALYDEPTQYVWRGPYKLKAFVTWPDGVPEAREEGMKTNFENSTAWLSRLDVESIRMPYPAPGDIVKFWSVPFFRSVSVGGLAVPNAGYYFDVLDADDDGHIFDQASFVGFKLELKRRTEFTPERKIFPP